MITRLKVFLPPTDLYIHAALSCNGHVSAAGAPQPAQAQPMTQNYGKWGIDYRKQKLLCEGKRDNALQVLFCGCMFQIKGLVQNYCKYLN